MKHKIEVFTSGCDECVEAVELVQKYKPEDCGCDYKVHDLATLCGPGDCGCGCDGILAKIKEYDIKAIPSVVLDGKIAIEGKTTEAKVKAMYQSISCK